VEIITEFNLIRAEKKTVQPFPLISTSWAVGALTLHTGVLNRLSLGHKKCPLDIDRLYPAHEYEDQGQR
jgi:hypothetical protein